MTCVTAAERHTRCTASRAGTLRAFQQRRRADTGQAEQSSAAPQQRSSNDDDAAAQSIAVAAASVSYCYCPARTIPPDANERKRELRQAPRSAHSARCTCAYRQARPVKPWVASTPAARSSQESLSQGTRLTAQSSLKDPKSWLAMA